MNNPTLAQRIVRVKTIVSVFNEATELLTEEVVVNEKVSKADSFSIEKSTPPVKDKDGKYIPGNKSIITIRLEKSR